MNFVHPKDHTSIKFILDKGKAILKRKKTASVFAMFNIWMRAMRIGQSKPQLSCKAKTPLEYTVFLRV